MADPASGPPGGPSAWVSRFLPAAPPAGGRVLDLAAGGGRHVVLARGRGWTVVAADRETAALDALAAADDGILPCEIELESGDPTAALNRCASGGPFDAVIVANYLYRPLLPLLPGLLAPDGLLLYETFMAGNEALGRPRNPDFLLRPGELLSAFGDSLTTVAFEQGYVAAPTPRVVQRYAGTHGTPVLPS